MTRARLRRNSFVDRYVFPDGELHEVGTVVSSMQAAGFEVRHVEGLREHYALTLRVRRVRNFEDNWDEAVAEAGSPCARIWRLYMAASALNFEGRQDPGPSGPGRAGAFAGAAGCCPAGLVTGLSAGPAAERVEQALLVRGDLLFGQLPGEADRPAHLLQVGGASPQTARCSSTRRRTRLGAPSM